MIGWPEAMTDWVEDLARQVIDQAGVTEPPIDARRVAQHLGLEVLRNREQLERGRLVEGTGAATIVVRSEPRPERYQWSIAHEIGEFLLPRGARSESAPAGPWDSTMLESLANRFASVLLTPLDWFLADARDAGYDLPTLKRRYATASHEVIALRTLEGPAPAVILVFDNGRLTRRLGNLSCRPPRLLSIEKECQREAMLHGTAEEREDTIARVRAWPIHEEGWRREIVRTEPKSVELE